MPHPTTNGGLDRINDAPQSIIPAKAGNQTAPHHTFFASHALKAKRKPTHRNIPSKHLASRPSVAKTPHQAYPSWWDINPDFALARFSNDRAYSTPTCNVRIVTLISFGKLPLKQQQIPQALSLCRQQRTRSSVKRHQSCPVLVGQRDQPCIGDLPVPDDATGTVIEHVRQGDIQRQKSVISGCDASLQQA